MKNNSNAASPSLNRRLGTVLMILLFALPLITPPMAVARVHRYRLKITNYSRYDIHRIYMSSAETNRWGRDLLGDSVLVSSYTFTITDIVPGEWDVMFVDEDGDACILKNVKVFEDLSWGITDKWLINCERSGRCHCQIW